MSNYIDLKEIVNTMLAREQASIHRFYRYVIFAAEAVQELQMMGSLNMVNHTILKKDEQNDYFVLPKGYTDHVSIGVRVGSFWRPIASSNTLMGVPNSQGDGQFNNEFNSAQLNVNGGYTTWEDSVGATLPAAFNSDFDKNGFQTTQSQSTLSDNGQPVLNNFNVGISPFFMSDYIDSYGELKGRQFGGGDGMRTDVFTVNRALGLLIVPHNFPYKEVYMIYVSVGGANTMTKIPIEARACIMAYVDWKYEAKKRNGKNVAALEQEFWNQHRLMRARFNPFTPTDLKRIANQYYGQTQRIG